MMETHKIEVYDAELRNIVQALQLLHDHCSSKLTKVPGNDLLAETQKKYFIDKRTEVSAQIHKYNSLILKK